MNALVNERKDNDGEFFFNEDADREVKLGKESKLVRKHSASV